MFAIWRTMELGGLLDVGDEGERGIEVNGKFLTGPLGCCWYFLGDMVEGSDVGFKIVRFGYPKYLIKGAEGKGVC